MPTIGLLREEIFDRLNKRYTEEEFDELCFQFGIELDEVTSEKAEAMKGTAASESGKKVEELSEEIIYKIDIPANRYDLLCLEGLTRALRVFNGDEKPPLFATCNPASTESKITMKVDPSTRSVRPFVVCAILRGIKFDDTIYKSFIDLQEKLHQNVCRKRTYVAIGTHDLDTISPPFLYQALPKRSFQFAPLTDGSNEYIAEDLMEKYKTDPNVKHLKPYADLLNDFENYPVITDKNGVVLSLPPVINGYHSRIQLSTRNVFIECTATDWTKANIVLDTVVTMFSEYCSKPFTVETVDVHYNTSSNILDSILERSGVYEEGDTIRTVTPLLSKRNQAVSIPDINSLVGVPLEAERIRSLCERMQLGPTTIDQSKNQVIVTIPPTRSDVLHPVDVIEDVAIGYGYNNIPQAIPPTLTVGGPNELNHFCDLLRQEISRVGYTEVLTHGLCSIQENFTLLRRSIEPSVTLANPAVIEYETVRTSLLPGALKVVQNNKNLSVKDGLRLFEISDVVLLDEANAVGASNQRNLIAIYVGHTSGFEIIHGLIDRVMMMVQIAPTVEYAGQSMRAEMEAVNPREGLKYDIKPNDKDPTFFPKRCASINLYTTSPKGGNEQKEVGRFGILHPTVLKNYDIPYPCSAVELNLEALH